MELTTATGKKVALTRGKSDLYIEASGLKFEVDQTPTGCISRWAVPQLKQRVNIAFTGENLAKANAMFAELQAAIEDRMAEYRRQDAQYNAVIRGMRSDAGVV